MKLGLHNTWEELTEAKKASQLKNFKCTKTSRRTLRRLGYDAQETSFKKQLIPPALCQLITVAPTPRNMNLVFNAY